MKKSLALLTDLAQKDKDVLLVVGDLGFSLFDDFRQKCPNQFINAGIAEQNMLSVAAGLALEGKKVFVYSIANFPTLRALEQIKNDVAYHHANVKIISGTGGLNYGNLGMSHHTTGDLAALRAIPDIRIYNPGDVYEAQKSIIDAYNHNGTCYIRIGRCKTNFVHENDHFNVDDFIRIGSGKDVLLFNSGALLADAKIAYDLLIKDKIKASLVSVPLLKPINNEKMLKLLSEFHYIVTLDEHSVVGGFGSAVSEIVAQNNIATHPLIKEIGIPDEPYFEIGDHEYLKDFFGLSGEKIYHSVLEFIKK